jgi:hypothetical protein
MNPRSRPRAERRGRAARRSQRRPEKKTILIVCEGSVTERHYLDNLKRDDMVAQRFAVTVLKGRGGSRQQIVQRAVDRKNNHHADFDETWYLMDVERLETERSRQDLQAAIGLADQNHIKLCLSNPAFEVWILAHFIRSSRPFHDCAAVILELNRYWRPEFHIDYSKNDESIYMRIADRTTDAIANAKAVREGDHRDQRHLSDYNSATEVYRLVAKLVG